MLVARIGKETLDLRRVTVDFSPWLDSGEQIASFTTPAITQAASGWTGAWPPPQGLTPPPLPADPTPLVVTGSYLISAGTQVQLLLGVGTAGNLYQVQFVATGQSGRKQTIEINVQVKYP